jgi:hypothetical protein
LVTLWLQSIAGAWKILLAFGSGTGLVLILRWYWWRINAWSEIVAMVASGAGSLVLSRFFDADDPRGFAYLMLGTLLVTTVAWMAATFLTRPESEATLLAFYERVRPAGAGWGAIAHKSRVAPAGPGMVVRLRDWALGCALIYLSLFGVGKLLLGERMLGWVLLGGAALCGVLLARDLSDRAAAPEATPVGVEP